MQHPGGWQRCTEEPGIAMHGVHHCEQWTANRKRERYNMDVYLIRHGKTKGNLEGRYIGTTDEPLCEEGKQSLMQMADAKKYPAVEALFVSPMLRCRESAKILFPKQSISVVSDLRECDFGRYENKNFDFSACSILQFLFYLRQQLYRQLIQYGFPNAQCRESKPQFIRFGITQTVFVRTERNKIDEYYRC